MKKTLIFKLFMLSIISLKTESQELDYLNHVCIGDQPASYSVFQANKRASFDSLVANVAQHNGFYNNTVGESPNQVSSSILCRVDVPMDICQSCLELTITEIINLCSSYQQAIIWYTVCTLRYSNMPLFGIMEEKPLAINISPFNATNPSSFNTSLVGFMNGLMKKALTSGKLFSDGDVPTSGNVTIYGMLQCNPDINQTACRSCLSRSISYYTKCCGGRQGGAALKPSCTLRYEVFPFFDFEATFTPTTVSPLPSLSLPPQISAHSDPISDGVSKIRKTSSKIRVIMSAISAAVVLGILSVTLIWYKRRENYKKHIAAKDNDETSIQFDLHTVEAATNKFSSNNKIGEGGFGIVYKGKLPNGQEIAVKRLSKRSGQGVNEFKNEAVLVAKLQHRNLVRLLGYCLEGEEKILIYEFVPNKSLDYFLFDPIRRSQLDWPKRHTIIEGIARGLHYLHEDSRLTVIHRDLKPSNVLLDENMNAKISDFGMARIFKVDQMAALTSRVVGSYGYMSPEYAMLGQYSNKSDVYSFGVLMLEIITGKRNISFNQSQVGDKVGDEVGDEDLVRYAWRHWKNGTPLEITDPVLRNSCSEKEVSRCINIGLLCVQEDIGDRPAMTTILPMLRDLPVNLPQPRQTSLTGSQGTQSTSTSSLNVYD